MSSLLHQGTLTIFPPQKCPHFCAGPVPKWPFCIDITLHTLRKGVSKKLACVPEEKVENLHSFFSSLYKWCACTTVSEQAKAKLILLC